MDLYDDLPPAAGEDPQVSIVSNGNSWSKAKPTSITSSSPSSSSSSSSSSQSSSSSSTSTTISSESQPISKPFAPVRLVPSTLAFKPRQAKPAAQISAPSAPIVPVTKPTTGGIYSAPVVSIDSVTKAPSTSVVSSIHASETTTSKSENVVENVSDKSVVDDVELINATFDVPNPYDPALPNDYLAWCEQRLERNRALKIEEENRRQIEERDRQRQETERLRAEAVVAGDFKLLQSTMGAGRGRGRGGLNNLPAWMTQQAPPVASPATEVSSDQAAAGEAVIEMRKRALSWSAYEDAEGSESADTKRSTDHGNVAARVMSKMGYKEGEGLGRDGHGITAPIEHRVTGSGRGAVVLDQQNQARFEQSRNAQDSNLQSEQSTTNASSVLSSRRRQGMFRNPSCVILIKNMVGPGEVDSSLAAETKQECSKFGTVVDCLVREIKLSQYRWMKTCPEEEAVRMFVYFSSQESAIKAYKDLNGRFFGGRQITAAFYDEDKFMAGDLDPVVGEW